MLFSENIIEIIIFRSVKLKYILDKLRKIKEIDGDEISKPTSI